MEAWTECDGAKCVATCRGHGQPCSSSDMCCGDGACVEQNGSSMRVCTLATDYSGAVENVPIQVLKAVGLMP